MRGIFITVLLPGLLLAGLAFAQDADEATDSNAAAAEAAERESLEPAVDTATARRVSDSGVMDELDLDRTEITGNQELPKVLYIVPWQKSDPGDLMGRPANTLLDEVLAPIDRGEFVRQVRYYDELQEKQPEAAQDSQ